MEKNNFQVIVSENQENVVIGISGFLDAHTAPFLENAIKEQIDKKVYNINIDFENLDYISSAGFGVFMEFIEEIRENGGDLVLVNMKQKIRKLFELLGFDLLFKIYSAEDQI